MALSKAIFLFTFRHQMHCVFAYLNDLAAALTGRQHHTFVDVV